MSVKDLESDEMFPTWVQVLKPTGDDGDDDDSWVGKLRAVKKSIKNVGVSVDKKVDAVDKNVAEVNKKVDAVDSKLEKLATDNAEMKDLLLKFLSNAGKETNSFL